MKGVLELIQWINSALNGRSPGLMPHDPNGASMTRRSPHGAHPRSRVRFAFTDVSAMKTTRSGCTDTAGRRCLNQLSRCRLTLARRRLAATSDFFWCIAKLAKDLTNRAWVRPYAGRIVQGRGHLRHRDVAILRNDSGEDATMRVKLPLAFGATLRSRARSTSPPDRKPPTRPGGRRKLQTQCRGAPA